MCFFDGSKFRCRSSLCGRGAQTSRFLILGLPSSIILPITRAVVAKILGWDMTSLRDNRYPYVNHVGVKRPFCNKRFPYRVRPVNEAHSCFVSVAHQLGGVTAALKALALGRRSCRATSGAALQAGRGTWRLGSPPMNSRIGNIDYCLHTAVLPSFCKSFDSSNVYTGLYVSFKV